MRKYAILFALCLVAAGAGHAADRMPNRLSTAKPGEWVSYKLPNGYIQKLTVDKRSSDGPEAQVEILVDNIYDGEIIESKRITHEAGEPYTDPGTSDRPGVLIAVRNETVPLAGRTIPVGVVEILKFTGDKETDSSTEWWVSREIPVFGIYKKVEDGETEWELVDYGEK